MYLGFALTGLVITLIVAAVSMRKAGTAMQERETVCSKIIRFIDRYYLVFLFLLFVLFLITRIYKLDSFPNGINVDELGTAVDSKCIRFHGTDRHGIRFPVYFQNYGGGQSALYTYTAAFLLSFFPSGFYAFRLPAVIYGAVCFFFTYAICIEITQNKWMSLAGPALVTMLPVYFMMERWALDCNLFLPVSTVAMYFVVRALKYSKWYDWLLAGLAVGATLYTYVLSYIVIPLFLLFMFVYVLRLKQSDIRRALCFIIPVAALAMPLILYQLVNFGILEPFSIGPLDFVPLTWEREKDLGLANVLENWKFFREMFLGGEFLTYNSFVEFGTVYMFLLPLVAAGMIICIRDTAVSFRERKFSVSVPILSFFVSSVIVMLLLRGANVNRVNQIYMPVLLFVVVALYRLFEHRYFMLAWTGIWTVASFVFFAYFYFALQNSVYGYHPLHDSASPAKAVVRSESSYIAGPDTHIYMLATGEKERNNMMLFYFVGGPDDMYDESAYGYANVTLGMPAEIDINEDAVYIIGSEWPHITSWLISQGFMYDQSLPEYSILFKMKNN